MIREVLCVFTLLSVNLAGQVVSDTEHH